MCTVPDSSYYFLHLHKASGNSVISELYQKTTVQYVVCCEECATKMIHNRSVLPISPRLFTFVRHPVDRVISEFNYNIMLRETYKSHQDVKLKEFSDFARSEGPYAKHRGARKGNIHFFNRLTGDLPTLLRSFWFVGASEFFDSSMCILLHKMGIPDRKRCACSARTKTAFIHNDHQVNHSISSSTITADLRMRILNSTKPDLELFEEGIALLLKEADRLKHSTGINFLCHDRPKLIKMVKGKHHGTISAHK